MTNKDVFNSIGNVDEKFIEEAIMYSPNLKRTPKISRRLLVAAVAIVLALALISCAVASDIFGIKVLDVFSSRDDGGVASSGYDLAVSVKKISEDDFQGKVSGAGNLIVRQFRERQPESSWFPGHWQSDFDDRHSAYEFVGLDGMREIDMKLPEKYTNVNVYGTSKGCVNYISIDTVYSVDNLYPTISSRIYTEGYPNDIVISFRNQDGLKYEQSTYNAENAVCEIIKTSENRYGYMSAEGFIAEGSVLYSIQMGYRKEDAEKAMQLIYEWADKF